MTPEPTPAGAPLPDVTLPPGYHLAVLGPQDEAAVLEVDSWAFAFELPPDVAAGLPYPLEPGRTVGVRAGTDDDAPLVAVHTSYAFTGYPVPGGRVDAAGLSWVAVLPHHRRRGLARAMVLAHLARTRARGEALSVLFAAEPDIYGRFGYGCAAYGTRLTVPRGARLRDVPGWRDLRLELERADVERHTALVERVHAAAARPGQAPRHTFPLQMRAVVDFPAWRDGGEPLRLATVWAGDEPRGYALFRRKERWGTSGSPEGTATVRESATLDAAAARALWGLLTDLDLMVSVETGILPADDPLLHLLTDLRPARRTATDNVWVRLVDVPAALAARRYASAVDVVLEVDDALLPDNAGRWRLRGGPDGARVDRTDAPADVELDVRELGAVYLGGVGLGALAAAGLVRERTPGAAAAAATAFGWPLAPVCDFIF